MAGNIKGIIVEIGGDTSGLQNALKKVNSATASLSKELKGINTMLKLDPKNTELLAQKQTVLKQNISETTKKLDMLKASQYEFIKAGGDVNGENYRALQREIIKTEGELKTLKTEASNWTSASKSLGELSTKMTNFGEKVTEAGKKVSVLSAAVGSLFVAGTKYNADMERYTTAFKTFLGSTEEAEEAIENIKKQSEASPFDTADLIKSNQMLITADVNAEDARKTISALADAIALTGGGNDELTRMASNLQQIKNIGKASSADIKQFGMAGIDVYGLLSDSMGKTTEEIKKMDITYEELSIALQKGASEGGKYFNGQAQIAETLTGQIGKLKKSFKDLTGELSKSLYPTIKKVAEGLQKLVDWFKNLDDGTKQIIAKIGVFVTALGPALVIIGKLISTGGTIAGGLSKITGIIAKVTASSGGLSSAISALAGPIGIIIAVVAALTAAFIYFYNTNSEFREKVISVWNNICKMFTETVMPIMEELWETISTVIQQIIGIVTELWQKIEPIVLQMLTWMLEFWESTLKGIVTQVIEFVAKLYKFQAEIYSKFILPIMKFLLDTLWPVIESVIKNTVEKTQGLMESIGKIISSVMKILNGIIDFISGVFSGDWEKAWNGIKAIFSGIWETMKTIVTTIFNNIKTTVSTVWGNISGTIQTVIENIKGFVSRGLESVSTTFSNIFNGIWNIIKGVCNSILGGIESMVNGVISGLNRMISALNNIKIEIPDWIPEFGGKKFGFNIPTVNEISLPRLEKGGIVDQATIAMIGEGKSPEAIIPLDRTLTKYMAKAMKEVGGTRNITLNFYPQQMNEQELNRAFDYVERRFSLSY